MKLTCNCRNIQSETLPRLRVDNTPINRLWIFGWSVNGGWSVYGKSEYDLSRNKFVKILRCIAFDTIKCGHFVGSNPHHFIYHYYPTQRLDTFAYIRVLLFSSFLLGLYKQGSVL